MIIDTHVLVILNSKNIQHYKNLGYKIVDKPNGKTILVNVSDLTKGSCVLVNTRCYYCKSEKKIAYKEYIRNISHNNKFSCSNKCGSIKRKELSLEKYGVDNPSKLKEIKEKVKKTNIEKYGVEYKIGTRDFIENSKKTNIEKYGVDNPMKNEHIKNKLKEKNLEKWGVENVFQSYEIKKKIKETNLERYGVDHYSKTNEYISKCEETNMLRYGFKNYSKTSEFKNRIINLSLEKWGVENYMLTDDFKIKSRITNIGKYGEEYSSKYDLVRKKNNINCKDINYIKYIGNNISLYKCEEGHLYEINSDNYHSRSKSRIPLCTVCNPIGDSQSIKEKELFEFIKSIYNGDIVQSYRDSLEIDIYLPELKLGFEFNGLYWHSDKYRDKNYHINKTKYFKEKGIRIIHIWEDDWYFRKDILKSQIKNWLGLTETKIFARKCYVKEIKDSKVVTKFLEENHIQGKVGSNLKLGLYYNDDLVSLMTFNHYEGRKKMEAGGWNISRFCNKIEMNIVGGASKIFKYFLKNYDVKRVISYSDHDWSEGALYKKLGFNKVSESKPDYKYIFEGKRVHKSRFRKSKLDTDLTESEYMKKSQIFKIWDCGKIKWLF
jgi:hypothetical protein